MVESLLRFIDDSPSAYHCVDNMKEVLTKAGYKELSERDSWSLLPGDKAYVEKNGSALIAFEIGRGDLSANGMRIIAAHTDSPAFKIKPHACVEVEKGYVKLNVESYGGLILSSWMDRPLSIAGRLILKGDKTLEPVVRLIDVKRPVCIIPNLAIHFNRDVNNGHKYNVQTEFQPVIALSEGEFISDEYMMQFLAEEAGIDKQDILDYELFLYPEEKSVVVGLRSEFISAPRLDDLWMVYTGLRSLIESRETQGTKLLVCMDNEEVGSLTAQGARSSFIETTINRIHLAMGIGNEDYYRGLAKSILLSADLAHGVHPNYMDKHDPTNRPILGKGPVIKYSATQKYATTGVTSAIFSSICSELDIPYQTFVNRSDIVGGSTIGPITSSMLAIQTLDVGLPILGMHSVREMGAVADHDYAVKAFIGFYEA